MAAMSIVAHGLPYDSHEYYDVTFYSDEIRTLLTSCSDIVDSWISETFRIYRPELRQVIVGLDVEWRPNFNRNQDNPVATLQLCINRRCLIFQIIHAPQIPQSLVDFLNSNAFTFVGVGIQEDVEKLLIDYNLQVSNIVDLRNLAADKLGRRDLMNAGLQGLSREFLGKEISKPRQVRMSRWDNSWLTLPQIQYACIDAFLSSEIGKHFNS